MLSRVCRVLAVLTCCLGLVLPGPAYTQTAEKEIAYVKQYFSGHRVYATYREGGPVYGTYFELDVHYCQSGQFFVYGKSTKQTVLDNQQINNWEEYGRWDIVRYQGQVGIWYASSNGNQDFLPTTVNRDGSVSVGNGVSIKRTGRAQCG